MNNNETNELRSSLLLSRQESILVCIDMQAKLVPMIHNSAHIEWNIDRLIKAAAVMKVPGLITEQYPKGLGHTVERLSASMSTAAAANDVVYEKTMFSCRECTEILNMARAQRRHQFVLTGIETHVCVLQSALDFIAAGVDVFVVADAVGSRSQKDYQIALQRMQVAGATLVTTESVMFEWCEFSGTPEFKQISQLVKELAPK